MPNLDAVASSWSYLQVLVAHSMSVGFAIVTSSVKIVKRMTDWWSIGSSKGLSA